jgi:hypothetical protein
MAQVMKIPAEEFPNDDNHLQNTLTSNRPIDRRVIVCIPHFQCKEHIHKAVQSILEQTHRDLTVVVANDGDSDPPWNELSSIQDARLVRFDLKQNRGPYFATTVVLHASDAPYLLIQDADDWSDRQRVDLLLAALERDHSDFAVSAQTLFAQKESSLHPHSIRWTENSTAPAPQQRFVINPCLTDEYRYRAPHHGLFRSQALRDAGAYYAGFRLSYDRLITNLMLMTGRVSHVQESLYSRLIRTDSITHSPNTAWNSHKGMQEFETGRRLYALCFKQYLELAAGRLSLTAFLTFVQSLSQDQIVEADQCDLDAEVGRLKSLLVKGPNGDEFH